MTKDVKEMSAEGIRERVSLLGFGADQRLFNRSTTFSRARLSPELPCDCAAE